MLSTIEIRKRFRSPDPIRPLPLEMSESLPCPRIHDGVLLASCFFYGTHFDVQKDAALVFTPSWRADFNWVTGDCLDYGKVEGPDVGFPGSRFEPVGEWSFREVDKQARLKSLGGAVEREREINALYDLLVPRWLNGGRAGPEAARFAELFKVESIFILAPAYFATGRDFFRWIGLS